SADKAAWLPIFHDAFRDGLTTNAGHASRNAALVRNFIKASAATNAKPIKTGIEVLDEFLGGGLTPGNLYAIGAQTKVG
ncbi:hypothetical protein ABTD55_23845, partial [Acinetobacter baumannii]